MDLLEVTRRDKRRTFLSAVALAAIVAVLMPPVVQAAIQKVKVQGTVKTADTTGDSIESEAIPPMGLLQAEGSDGALAVRTFGGGGGLLRAGDCTASTEPAQGPLPNTGTVSTSIITGIIITGTGTVRVSTDALSPGVQLPLANFTVNANHPNEFVGLGNGLTVTSPLTFTGVDGTACNWVVLGQTL